MVKITVEMWPHGDESKKYLLGEAIIANVGGTKDIGHYDVRLLKSARYAKSEGIWKKGAVLNFPRLRLGPWDLLYRALHACVASRNKGVA